MEFIIQDESQPGVVLDALVSLVSQDIDRVRITGRLVTHGRARFGREVCELGELGGRLPPLRCHLAQ